MTQSVRDRADIAAVIKAYDVRGVYPDQFDADFFRDLGTAFVQVVGSGDHEGRPSVVVGHDMRPSAAQIVAEFAEGVTRCGVDVIIIGLCSTDGLYFASGSLNLPGAMFTASHNPAEYNGVKFCRQAAAPVGQDTGLRQIADALLDVPAAPAAVPGVVSHRDVMPDYVAFLHNSVDLRGIKPLKIAVDAGNGMAGLTAPAVFSGLPLDVIEMYFDLDGTFPNHEANPIEPANLRDLQAKVRETGADLGLAFDGDADRCFVVDDKGEIVDPSTLTALIASRELAAHPGSAIIYNLISSRAVAETIEANGGIGVRSRVGHSFIKAEMAAHNAIFGGEHSGHFYFRDFWRADSGILAALHVLAALGSAPEGTTLSQLLAPFATWQRSGEINSRVADVPAALARIERIFDREGVAIDHLDGVTVNSDHWWFNMRASNTEPLLRLNVEARSAELLAQVTSEALAVIRA